MALKLKYENLFPEMQKLLTKLKFVRDLLKSETEINTFLHRVGVPKSSDTQIKGLNNRK